MRALLLLGVLALAACGPTIGDACTTANDCAGAICINQDFAPGGYCSTSCTPGGAECPTGSTCVRNALGNGGGACFRMCNVPGDCRTGYSCLAVQDGPRVCIGPAGL